jgi:hypothetical protein
MTNQKQTTIGHLLQAAEEAEARDPWVDPFPSTSDPQLCLRAVGYAREAGRIDERLRANAEAQAEVARRFMAGGDGYDLVVQRDELRDEEAVLDQTLRGLKDLINEVVETMNARSVGVGLVDQDALDRANAVIDAEEAAEDE